MLRKLVSVLSAAALACGLMPVTAMAEESTEDASSLQLEAGTYVEHEAIAYVVDDAADGIAPFSLGGDILSGSQDLMTVDVSTAEEALGVDADGADADEAAAVSALSRTRSNAAADAAETGRLVLVRDDSKTVEELVAALEDDPRVVFAEPNYLVESEDEGDDAAAATQVPTDASGTSADLADTDGTGDGGAEGGSADADAGSGDADGSARNGDGDSDDGVSGTDPQTGSGMDAGSVSDANAAFGQDPSASVEDLTSLQWGFSNDGSMDGISPDEAVDMGYDNWNDAEAAEAASLEDVVVAVIDSGVDASNPDLASVMWDDGDTIDALFALGGDEHGLSTASGTTSTTGLVNYHGTHVAGIIAADWDNQGISGMAPNVQIMSLRHSDTLSSLLACLNYAKVARDEGVNVRVANNSWGLGQCASRSIDLAVTELGERGVASVFGSGNSTADNDAASSLSTTLADNPYVVVVDAIEPSGEVAGYSQYGQTTTDVMAPGSVILSTWATGENNGQGSAEGQKYLGEADSDPVLYESFDGESSFDDAVALEDGTKPVQGERALSFFAYGRSGVGEPVGEAKEGTSFVGAAAYAIPYDPAQGSGSLYQTVVTNVADLSQVADKPRYLSMRYSFKDAEGLQDGQLPYGQVAIAVKLKQDSGYTWAQLVAQGASGVVDWQGSYYDLGGTAIAVDSNGQQAQIQLTADMIDWEHFQLQITFVVVPVSTTGGVQTPEQTPVPCTILLDSIGLGSDVVPYQYEQGTSMATPAVTGAAAIIAGEGLADVEGDAAKSAEKLAALVRGAAQPDERYEVLCSTGGYATVDGADNPGPAITKVVDEGETIEVQGYFRGFGSLCDKGLA